MSTGLHKDVAVSERHPAPSLTYANAAARTGATGLTSDDVGRVAHQTDNDSFWWLKDDSPLTWVEADSTAGAALTSTAPVDVTRATAAVGTGTEAARNDHKHDITVAAPGTITPGDTAAQGSASSVALSDHQHAIAAFGTGVGTFCQGNDSRLSDSRPPNGAASGDLTGTYPGPTVANDAVDNAALANMVQATIKGRAAAAGTGDPTDLTAAQATAILNAFTSSLKGLVPSSGGGTTNFLRADGTFAAPAGGGVFGNDYDHATSNGESSTTSTAFQSKLQYVTSALTGTYRVSWTALVYQSSVADDVQARLYNVTDATDVTGTVSFEPKEQSDRFSVGGFAEVSFSGSAKTFEIQFRQQRGGTAYISDAKFEIWRVS